MSLDFKDLISLNLYSHTNEITKDNNSEKLTYYINNVFGITYLDTYYLYNNQWNINEESITLFAEIPNQENIEFIQNIFNKLDPIIDLDFEQMNHNNGSLIDIYKINYSSTFTSNVIGQAISQSSPAGKWWDIIWKKTDSKKNLSLNDKNTIIHEIGHCLGLSHPDNDPNNKDWKSIDTIMSYDGSEGWSTWFTKYDLDALKSLWGREDDNGNMNFEKDFNQFKFKRENQIYSIITETGYEEITNLDILIFSDTTKKIKEDIIGVFDLIEGKDDITGKIYRIYNTAFGRFPDKEGYKYWIERNRNNEIDYINTCLSFIQSPEFIDLYGNQISNTEYLKALYKNVLNRDADESGFAYWMNQLDSGTEDRNKVLMGFAESNENKTLFSGETGI